MALDTHRSVHCERAFAHVAILPTLAAFALPKVFHTASRHMPHPPLCMALLLYVAIPGMLSSGAVPSWQPLR